MRAQKGVLRLVAFDASLETFGGDREKASRALAVFFDVAASQLTSMTMDRQSVVPIPQELESINRRVQELAGRRRFYRPTQIMLDLEDPQSGELFCAWAYWCLSARLVGPRCDFELVEGGDYAEFRLDERLHRRLVDLLAEQGLAPGATSGS